ncbi:hypothetical protein [Streptomyces reticuli]|uniref:hypothetical protein n=1 Tax=Streptomyces reticuli TaxID=1926 RepID=UPI00073DE8BE|nr:hypothetical protein [Streptomyces sp. SID7810]CUW30085.1 hypothetical protein TUE45_04804 [Streptomyces reticuli]
MDELAHAVAHTITHRNNRGIPMEFIKTHPARIYAVVVAVLALVAHFVPSLPSPLILGVVAAVLGTGEAVQRVENGKTLGAYTGQYRP